MASQYPPTSLIRVSKEGNPTSYIKGVNHITNNVCRNTMNALYSCTTLLHETGFGRVSGLYSSEDIIEYHSKYRKMKAIHLDDIPREIFEKIYNILDKVCPDRQCPISQMKTYGVKWVYDVELCDPKQYSSSHIASNDEEANLLNLFDYWSLDIRNAMWVDQILDNFEKEPCFISTGMAHVAGIIDFLEKEGYTITYIPQMF